MRSSIARAVSTTRAYARFALPAFAAAALAFFAVRSGQAAPYSECAAVSDGDASTAWRPEASGDRAVIRLAGVSLVRGAIVDGACAGASLRFYYEREGEWHPFLSGSLPSGASGRELFVDLGAAPVFTAAVAVEVLGEASSCELREVSIVALERVPSKLAPSALEDGGASSAYAPAAFAFDGRVETIWRASAIAAESGPVEAATRHARAVSDDMLGAESLTRADGSFAGFIARYAKPVAADSVKVFAPASGARYLVSALVAGQWRALGAMESEASGWMSFDALGVCSDAFKVEEESVGDASGAAIGIGEVELWGWSYGADLSYFAPAGAVTSSTRAFAPAAAVGRPKALELSIEGEGPEAIVVLLNGSPVELSLLGFDGVHSAYRSATLAPKAIGEGANALSYQVGDSTLAVEFARLAPADSGAIAFSEGSSLSFEAPVSLEALAVDAEGVASARYTLAGESFPASLVEDTPRAKAFGASLSGGFAADGVAVESPSVLGTLAFGSSQARSALSLSFIEPRPGDAFLCGFVSDGLATVTIDGAPASRSGHYFWTTLESLSLSADEARLVTARAETNDGQAAECSAIIGASGAPLLALDQGERVETIDEAIVISGSVGASGATVTVSGAQAPLSGTRFFATVALEVGFNDVTVEADFGDGKRVVRTVRVIRHPRSLDLSIQKPANFVATPELVVRGRAWGSGVTAIFVDGVHAAKAGATGAFEIRVPLVEGRNEFSIKAVDSLGREASCAVAAIRDTRAPELAVDPIASGTWTNAAEYELRGKALDANLAFILIDGVSIPFGADGSFSHRVAPAEGRNEYEAVAIDRAGYKSRSSLVVMVDRASPEPFALGFEAATWTGDSCSTLTFSTTDALSGVDRYEVSVDGGAWRTATSPCALPGLADGRRILAVRAIDRAGNERLSALAVEVSSAPLDVDSAKAIPGNRKIVVLWKPVEHAIRYDLTRNPAWDDSSVRSVTECKYIDAGTENGRTYSYSIVAVGAGGGRVEILPESGELAESEFLRLRAEADGEALPAESNSRLSASRMARSASEGAVTAVEDLPTAGAEGAVSAISGAGFELVTPGEATIVDYETATVELPEDSLPEGVDGVVVEEVVVEGHEDVKAIMVVPVAFDEAGDFVEAPSGGLDAVVTLACDAPDGVPHSVYTYDLANDRWVLLPAADTAIEPVAALVDTDAASDPTASSVEPSASMARFDGRALARSDSEAADGATSDDSEGSSQGEGTSKTQPLPDTVSAKASNTSNVFSIQATQAVDLSREDVANMGYSPRGDSYSQGMIEVSPSGSAKVSCTDLMLVGRNGFVFKLDRYYDSTIAREDTVRTVLAAGEAFDVNGTYLAALKRFGLPSDVAKIDQWGKDHPGATMSPGAGWRFNIPVIRKLDRGNGKIETSIVLPDGSVVDVADFTLVYDSSNGKVDPKQRTLRFEHRLDGNPMVLEIKQNANVTNRTEEEIVYEGGYEGEGPNGRPIIKKPIQSKFITHTGYYFAWVSSSYTLITADGKKWTFREDGRPSSMIDATGANSLTFTYSGTNQVLLSSIELNGSKMKMTFSYEKRQGNQLQRISSVTANVDTSTRSVAYGADEIITEYAEAYLPRLGTFTDLGGKNFTYDYSYANNAIPSNSADGTPVSVVTKFVPASGSPNAARPIGGKYGGGDVDPPEPKGTNVTVVEGSVILERPLYLSEIKEGTSTISSVSMTSKTLEAPSGLARLNSGFLCYRDAKDKRYIVVSSLFLVELWTGESKKGFSYGCNSSGLSSTTIKESPKDSTAPIVKQTVYEFGQEERSVTTIADLYLSTTGLNKTIKMVTVANVSPRVMVKTITVSAVTKKDGALEQVEHTQFQNNYQAGVVNTSVTTKGSGYATISTCYKYDTWLRPVSIERVEKTSAKTLAAACASDAVVHTGQRIVYGNAVGGTIDNAANSTPTIHDVFPDPGLIGRVASVTYTDQSTTSPSPEKKESMYYLKGLLIAKIESGSDSLNNKQFHRTRYQYDENREIITIAGPDLVSADTEAIAREAVDVASTSHPVAVLAYATSGIEKTITRTMNNIQLDAASSGASSVVTSETIDLFTGKTLRSVDAEGNATSIVYDALGRPVCITEAGEDDATKGLNEDNARTFIAYNDAARMVTVYREDGSTTRCPTDATWKERYTYDVYARLEKIEKDVGLDDERALQTTVVTYDTYGNVHEIKDSSSVKALVLKSYTYDGLGRVLTETMPDPNDATKTVSTTMVYALDGWVTITDPRGYVIKKRVDAGGRDQAIVSYPHEIGEKGDAVTTEIFYDGFGRPIEQRANGVSKKTSYDFMGRVVRVEMPSCASYWLDGRQVSGREVVSYAYDARGAKVSEEKRFKPNDGVESSLGETYYTNNTVGMPLLSSTKVERTLLDEDGATSTNVSDWIVSGVRFDRSGRVVGEYVPSYQSERPNGVPVSLQEGIVRTYSTRGEVATETLGRATTTFKYDLYGRKASIEDPNGFTATLWYDHADRLAKAILPASSGLERVEQAFAYTARGYLSERQDPDGTTTAFELNARGMPTLATKSANQAGPAALSLATSYRYDKSGNAVSVATGDVVVGTDYDGLGRAVRISRGQGDEASVESISYDAFGNVIGRRVEKIGSSGAVVESSSTYDAMGRKTSDVDGEGKATRYYYDATGALARVEYANGTWEAYLRDVLGRVVEERRSDGKSILYEYDARSLVAKVKERDGAIVENEYDAAGRLTLATKRGIDGRVLTQERTYDPAGNLMSIVEGDSTISYNLDVDGQYKPDPYGRITSVTRTASGKSQRVSYTYDKYGRIEAIVYPDGTSVPYAYDGLGRATGMAGWISQMGYDSSGRLDGYTFANGIVADFAYDSKSRLASLDYRGNEGFVAKHAFKYDAADNTTEKTFGVAASVVETYEYYRNGMLKSSTEYKLSRQGLEAYGIAERDVDGSHDYSQAGAGAFTSMATSAIGTMRAARAIAGGAIKGEWTGGQVDEAQFSRDRLSAHVRVGANWSKVEDDAWTLEKGGDGSMRVVFDVPVYGDAVKLHSSYDARDIEGKPLYSPWTLTAVDIDFYDDTTRSYVYDGKGNRTSVTTVKNGASAIETYEYVPGSDLIKRAGDTWYEYDDAGRLVKRGAREGGEEGGAFLKDDRYYAYEYDLAGRMIASVRSIDGIDRHTAYEYWPDGTLAEKRESNGDARTYVYGAGVEMLSETYAFGGAVETTDYVWCMGKLVGRVTARNPGTEEVATDCAYYLTDQIGSVVAALDANANVLYTDEFDAFGASSTYGAKPETARFTGKHYDADVGLYYYNARWYNHKTGRFSTEDPLRDGNNWYMYCQNNPMTWIDPTGTQMTQDSVTNDTHDGGGVVTPSEVYSAEDFKNAVQADLDKYKTAAEKKDDEIKKEIKRMEAWGVFAVWDGVVMKVGRVEDDPNNPYGNRVYIKHPDGSVTMYAHLDSIPAWVVVGAEVAEGQQIGVMGKTGTDNKHLHFSYFKPGVKGYTSGYASDGSAFIAAHSMPCNTYACNPYGSSACNPKLSKHEGIDFSGLECNLIPDWQYGLSGVFLTNALYDDRLETVKK